MVLRVAIPSDAPGGLDAPMARHFGHCDCFTIVDLEQGEIRGVYVVDNAPHSQGGCMVPVTMLARERVNVLIAGGMGMRPLLGFLKSGIDVLQDTMSQTVKDAIRAYLNNTLSRFSQDDACKGGGGGPGHCDH